jgi:hypothetical protein
MRKKKLLSSSLTLGMIFLGTVTIGFAQETGGSKDSSQSESAKDVKPKSWAQNPAEAYHLDFSIIEIEDGKRINSRQYSTNLSTNDSSEIKIGTRVPVEEKEGSFEYLDVGTSIFARVGEQRGQTELTVRADISSFAIPDQGEKHDSHPVLRQLKIGGTTLLPLGKPIIMGSLDDPNSKRQFQLEVTVTKFR